MEFEEIISALREGMKLTRKDGKFKYFPKRPIILVKYSDGTEKYIDKNGEFPEFTPIDIPNFSKAISVRIAGYSGGESIDIKYIYANPQMNSTYALLENGKIVSYPIDALYIYWKEIVLYTEEKPMEITIKDIEEKFGCKVKIIREEEK